MTDDKNKRNRIIGESHAPVEQLAEQYGLSRSRVYQIQREWQMASQAQPVETFASGAQLNQSLLFSQAAKSGVSYHGGAIDEEFQRELQDDGGIKIFTQMATHPVVSAVLFAIEMAQRQVDWYFEPASDKSADKRAAEFGDECIDDMAQTFDDIVSQVFSMLTYGYAAAELVYKKRLGQNPPKYIPDPPKSRFNDGKIGWRRWQFISPKSMPAGDRWTFDEYGRVKEIRQQAAPDYELRVIPIEKALLFRTSVKYDNPEGFSILRPMYQAHYYATNLQEVEAIGAERLGIGVPVIYLGGGTTVTGANSDFELAKEIVVNLRTDEQMGIVIPHPKLGAAGEGRGMLLEILNPSSRGFIDFNQVIERHEKRMAMTVLAQFIFLGMMEVGTQALNESATDTFQLSISAWSDMVADVVNRFAVPRLFALNPFKLDDLPQLSHSAVGVPDLLGIAEYVNKLVGAQVLTPDESLEKHLREIAKLPEQAEPAIEIVSEPKQGEMPEEVEEPETPEEPKGGETPEVEVVEEATETFALKTIKGALARDEQGQFARGGGVPLSEKEIALGDAVAFGKVTRGQLSTLQRAGLMTTGAKPTYTTQGKTLSRAMRTNPRKAMDQLAKSTGGAGLVTGEKRGPKVALSKPKSGGGGSGAEAKQTANRESVAGALEAKGIAQGDLDALAAVKTGNSIDDDTLSKLTEQRLIEIDADGLVTMTAPGRSLLSAANSGDVDRAAEALTKAGQVKGGGGGGKGKGGGKAKEEEKPKPAMDITPIGRLAAAGMSEKAAKAFEQLRTSGMAPDKIAETIDEAALGELVDAGLLEQDDEGAVTVTDSYRRLANAMKNGDWETVAELLGGAAMSDIVDEDFALRLKRGGPKWERATNAYEMQLRETYQDWAARTAAELATVEDDDEFNQRLEQAIETLIAALLLLGRRNLADAYQLGLAGIPASPDGMRELADTMAANDGYLADSLAPAIREKVLAQVRDDPLVRGDPDALAATFGTFLGRIGSYAGAYWALVHHGFGDRVKQEELALLLIEKRPPEDAKVPVYWQLDPAVKNHCGTCLAYGNQQYDSWDDMLAITGGILPANGTICNGNCRCSVSAIIDGEAQRVWTHLATKGGGLPPLRSLFSDEEDYGGAGSGHHGHKGIPGQRGGSSPGGAGISFAGRYNEIKDNPEAVEALSRQFFDDAGLSDSEIDTIFEDGQKWVKEFNMGNHSFQNDIDKGTKRAQAIHAWNQQVLSAENVDRLTLHRAIGKTQVQQMRDNRQGNYTWVGIRSASSWTESKAVAKEHLSSGGAIINGQFPAQSSFMSYHAFPTVFGKGYEKEHILTVGKQEGYLRWLRLKGQMAAEE